MGAPLWCSWPRNLRPLANVGSHHISACLIDLPSFISSHRRLLSRYNQSTHCKGRKHPSFHSFKHERKWYLYQGWTIATRINPIRFVNHLVLTRISVSLYPWQHNLRTFYIISAINEVLYIIKVHISRKSL